MKAAILGTGHIGTDLLMKLRKRSQALDVAMQLKQEKEQAAGKGGA